MTRLPDAGLILNNVLVSIAAGRIEHIIETGEFDALVSSDDAQLSMAGGVSGAILSAAGQEVANEAKPLVPLRVGDVAVTSAGRLPAKYILHAVTIDWEHGVTPSELTIRLVAQNVFRQCELLGVARLAMPALGTGAGQFSAQHSARLIVGALAEHVSDPTVIQEVVFCLPRDSERTAFVEYLERVRLDVWRQIPDTADAPSSRDDDSTRNPAAGKFGAAAPDRTGIPRHGLTDHVRRWLKRPDRPDDSAATATAPAGRVWQEPGEERTWYSWRSDSRPVVSNRYVLLEEVGRGGMGIVFLAWDGILRQTLAIKTLHPEKRLSPELAEALKREAAVQIRLAHEGIVRLLNFEPWDRAVGPYILMEYLPWPSAKRWLAEDAGANPRGVAWGPMRQGTTVGASPWDLVRACHLSTSARDGTRTHESARRRS